MKEEEEREKTMEDRTRAILNELDALLVKVGYLKDHDPDGEDMARYSKLVIGSILWIKNNLDVSAVLEVGASMPLEYGDVIEGLLKDADESVATNAGSLTIH